MNQVIGYVSLMDGLYKLSLVSDIVSLSLNVENVVAKRPKTKGKSSLLWHKHLGHISRQRIARLIKDNTLSLLNFDELGTCMHCIRGKFTKTKKKGTIRIKMAKRVQHTELACLAYQK